MSTTFVICVILTAVATLITTTNILIMNKRTMKTLDEIRVQHDRVNNG